VSSVETCIDNRLASLTRVSRMLDDLAASHGLAASTVADMHVALDEVLTNVITHGYPTDAARQIRVRLSLGAGVLEAEIEDDGVPFNPLAAPPPALGAPLNERPVGGLGIHFVRRLMTEVVYSFVDNHNRLVLRKRLADTPEGRVDGAA
jgi:anti-sigma regulatory factor (Ser/Thr protein kinase)